MGEAGERISKKSVARTIKTALAVSGLILSAPATFSLAETSPDNVAATDNAPAENTKPPSPASDKIAAVKDVISRTITSFGSDIRNTYHRELIANPKIDGEITVSFTVRPGGDVTDVKVDSSSLNWPPLENEILNRIGGWKFPPFEGEPIPATVPYRFHPN